MKASPLLAIVLTSCFATPYNSRAVLAPDQSGAVLRSPPIDAAREITRLMTSRGYSLLDQHIEGPALVLRLGGNREALTTGRPTSTTQFGSVFYARIAPAPEGSRVGMVGSPLLDDIEICTQPPSGQPCRALTVNEREGSHIDGVAEANVIHGVLSELGLEQLVVAPYADPALAPAPAPHVATCEDRRRNYVTAAAKVRDPDLRKKLFANAPSCD